VVLLVAVGVGGWILSHRNSPGPATHHHSHTTAPSPSASVLVPVKASAYDNPGEASLAIDGNPSTAWNTDYYDTSPYFGHLIKGEGLVLSMGRPVKISSVQVQFGPNVGANVQIKVSDSATPPSPLRSGSLPTVARATDIGNTYTFRLSHLATAQYVVIWISKLPPKIGNSSEYQAEIYNVVVRGTG
jgi:hypothetical protein